MGHLPVGVIDAGSNTVLGVVFRWDGEKESYRCFSLKDSLTVHAGLIRYVEAGRMTEEGLSVLSDALGQIRAFFAEKGVKTAAAFATASLRGVGNFADAATVAARYGFSLSLLSGEEEAQCDFAGMLQEMGWLEASGGPRFPESGVGLDLGGGSGQLLGFTSRSETGLQDFGSFPIGCLKLKRQFVSGDGTSPTDAELQAVKAFTVGQMEILSTVRSIDPASPPAFFAMGGTVKAVVRLFDTLRLPTSRPDSPGRTILRAEDLERGIRYFRSEEGRALIQKQEPGRKETLVTGLAVLSAICGRLYAPELTVLQAGVREGYVIRHLNP